MLLPRRRPRCEKRREYELLSKLHSMRLQLRGSRHLRSPKLDYLGYDNHYWRNDHCRFFDHRWIQHGNGRIHHSHDRHHHRPSEHQRRSEHNHGWRHLLHNKHKRLLFNDSRRPPDQLLSLHGQRLQLSCSIGKLRRNWPNWRPRMRRHSGLLKQLLLLQRSGDLRDSTHVLQLPGFCR